MKYVIKNSPNHYKGRGGWKPDILVCHQTGNDSLEKSLSWYMNEASNCCPTWVVDKDGTAYQLVSLDDAPYSNGTRTQAGQPLYYGLATSKLVKERKTNANFYTYSIEFVHCLHGEITDAQVQTAIDLIKEYIIPHMQKNGITPKIDREHVIGHCEIDPVTRALCPGKNFPYQRIIDGVNGSEKAVKVTKYIYYSYGQAAMREKPQKNGKILSRCERGKCYQIADTKTVGGALWLQHVTGEWSVEKETDGRLLFGKLPTYETISRLNVRSDASTTRPPAGVLEKGDKVFVIENKGEWAQIYYNGAVRYVASQYIKAVI